MQHDPEPTCDLVSRVSRGDRSAADQLWERLYGEMRTTAARLLRRDRGQNSLQPTALVHEAWMRLGVSPERLNLQDRAHLTAVAATAMRKILVDHHRRRNAIKRGGDRRAESMTTFQSEDGTIAYDLLGLNDALEQLKKMDERAARCIEQRLFVGLSNAELAEQMGMSLRSVQSIVQHATIFLHGKLSSEPSAQQ